MSFSEQHWLGHMIASSRHSERTAVELSIGKEPHKVCPVSWLNMVTLEVEGDVGEGLGIAVDVEGTDGAGEVLARFVCLFDLAVEVLGEVGRRWRDVSTWARMNDIRLGAQTRATRATGAFGGSRLQTDADRLDRVGMARIANVPSDEMEAPESLNSSEPI